MNHDAAVRFLDELTKAHAEPPVIPTTPPQCLDTGAAGVALFHAAQTHRDPEAVQRTHAWLRAAAAHGVDASDRAGLFYGLPALTLVLSLLPEDQYTRARDSMNRHLNTLVHQRVDAPLERIASGARTSFGEYDVIQGLSGIGAVLLRVDPNGAAMERLLGYLVRLTQPLLEDGQELPGWWVDHAPWHNPEPLWQGGHANLGTAHGISGVLALLSLAYRRGFAVQGQEEAIRRVCDHLDTWRQHEGGQVWWPSWITLTKKGTLNAGERGRISWCYGNPGMTRSQQLAGLALNDPDRCRMAEHAMAACLKPETLERVTEAGLCHGLAGLVQVAHRMAQDQDSSATPLRVGLTRATKELHHRIGPTFAPTSGLLNGALGTGLALSSVFVEQDSPGWDTCLLQII